MKFFKIAVFDTRVSILSWEKLNMIKLFFSIPESAVSAVASVVSLQVKDLVLVFIHDYKVKVEDD